MREFLAAGLIASPADLFRLPAHEAAIAGREGWGAVSARNLVRAIEAAAEDRAGPVHLRARHPPHRPRPTAACWRATTAASPPGARGCWRRWRSAPRRAASSAPSSASGPPSPTSWPGSSPSRATWRPSTNWRPSWTILDAAAPGAAGRLAGQDRGVHRHACHAVPAGGAGAGGGAGRPRDRLGDAQDRSRGAGRGCGSKARKAAELGVRTVTEAEWRGLAGDEPSEARAWLAKAFGKPTLRN